MVDLVWAEQLQAHPPNSGGMGCGTYYASTCLVPYMLFWTAMLQPTHHPPLASAIGTAPLSFPAQPVINTFTQFQMSRSGDPAIASLPRSLLQTARSLPACLPKT